MSCYDGQVFQSFLEADSLADDVVQKLIQARNGDLWIATEGGATRYRPGKVPPAIYLTNVSTDHPHGPVSQLLLSTAQDYLLFEFQGASLNTSPRRMVYVYRLEGYEPNWQVTRENRVEYTDLPRGEYVFQVKAVDRDLNYSETPATVKVTLHPPYAQLALMGGLGLALAVAIAASGYALRKGHQQRQTERALLREQQARLQAQEQLNRELEEELQTAHQMQMGLMPRESPRIAGLELAGRCLPANHVGGDFFKYYRLPQGRMLSVLADVTGHAMEAAVPLLMFSGVLESQVELGGSIEELFGRLNRLLHRTLPHHTFVCLAMGELDPATHILRLSNAGCPYPYHYQAASGQVAELRVEPIRWGCARTPATGPWRCS